MQVDDEQRIFARPGTVPQIHQSEAAECGLVCLNMIGWAHGQKIDLATLRRRYSLSLKGLTLRSLMEIAGQMGFAHHHRDGGDEDLHGGARNLPGEDGPASVPIVCLDKALRNAGDGIRDAKMRSNYGGRSLARCCPLCSRASG